MSLSPLPVAVLGAGPVGLAAAAHLADRGLPFVVLEAGDAPAASVRSWSHVRFFSPWRYVIDEVAAALLARAGWTRPDDDTYPTGADIRARYLEPLAATPEIAAHVRYGARVTGVARAGRDVMKDAGRESAAFLVRYETARGERDLHARAVVDATGTWSSPSPAGASGLPASRERALARAGKVLYGIPDVLGGARPLFAGRRVLVVGSGHSAFQVLLDLGALSDAEPATRVVWAVRRDSLGSLYGGGTSDQLAERGRLGQRARALADSGRLTIATGFRLERFEETPDGLVASDGPRTLPPVDLVVVATGFRPDLELLREVRLSLDPATEAPAALAPLIDPNVHSCGTVPPHGVRELAHPEPGVFVVGMKSYGRAPTFLLLTGYEQVRSVVAHLAGDEAAAREVRLVLPETGACGTNAASSSTLPVAAGACCG